MTILKSFFAAGMMLLVAAGSAFANSEVLRSYQAEADYADVRSDVENGILDAGLKIDYRGNIGEMLDRTGKDIGSEKKVYVNAEFFQFCSARLSRAAMEVDPANMAICPYVIFMYEPASTPGKITVGYKRPAGGASDASKAALKKIDDLLDQIVKDAAGM